MVSSTSTSIDFYNELQVDRKATRADIRAAYKRLALIWHPDRNKAEEAEEKFKIIKQAYEILSDEIRRKEYDESLREKFQQEQNWFESTSTNQHSFNFQAFDNLFSTPIDPLDILSDLQFFQESNFTSKMLNSPQYRQLYTQLFQSMNASHPNINLEQFDRHFRPTRRSHGKHRRSSKRASFPSIPVIHSTTANDLLLNQLIDHYEQQYRSSLSSFSFDDRFFQELNRCQYCQKKISTDRHRLIEHEDRCRTMTDHRRYQTRRS